MPTKNYRPARSLTNISYFKYARVTAFVPIAFRSFCNVRKMSLRLRAAPGGPTRPKLGPSGTCRGAATRNSNARRPGSSPASGTRVSTRLTPPASGRPPGARPVRVTQAPRPCSELEYHAMMGPCWDMPVCNRPRARGSRAMRAGPTVTSARAGGTTVGVFKFWDDAVTVTPAAWML
jgi:hypothetical protein